MIFIFKPLNDFLPSRQLLIIGKSHFIQLRNYIPGALLTCASRRFGTRNTDHAIGCFWRVKLVWHLHRILSEVDTIGKLNLVRRYNYLNREYSFQVDSASSASTLTHEFMLKDIITYICFVICKILRMTLRNKATFIFGLGFQYFNSIHVVCRKFQFKRRTGHTWLFRQSGDSLSQRKIAFWLFAKTDMRSVAWWGSSHVFGFWRTFLLGLRHRLRSTRL